MLRLLALIFVILGSTQVSFAWDTSKNVSPLCTPDVVGERRSNNDMCVMPERLIPALRLMKLLHPELKRLALQAQCGSLEIEDTHLSPLMTKERLVEFVFSKTDLETWECKRDLTNLKKLILANPHWEVEVVAPTPVPSVAAQRTAKDNRTLVFEGGLQDISVVDLHWTCYTRQMLASWASTFALVVSCALVLYGNLLAWYWSLRTDLLRA